MTFKSLICGTFVLCTFAASVQAQMPAPGASKPMGEASTPSQYKGSQSSGSVESRADVKAKAKAAQKDGSALQGEQSTPRQGKKPAPAVSEESRAQVKSEAAAANKADATPKGEESVKGQAKGSK